MTRAMAMAAALFWGSAAQASEAVGLEAVNALAERIRGELEAWRVGAEGDTKIPLEFMDKEGLRASLAGMPVASSRVSAMEFELVLGPQQPRWLVRTSLAPPGPALLHIEVRPETNLGLAQPIVRYSDELEPLARAAEWLGATLQTPECGAIPRAEIDFVGSLFGMSTEESLAALDGTARAHVEACGTLAGGQLQVLGLRLDDFVWILLDAEGKPLGLVNGDLDLVGPGALRASIGGKIRPLPLHPATSPKADAAPE